MDNECLYGFSYQWFAEDGFPGAFWANNMTLKYVPVGTFLGNINSPIACDLNEINSFRFGICYLYEKFEIVVKVVKGGQTHITKYPISWDLILY